MNSTDLPPLDALRAVLAATGAGSFSSAAERLGVTHAAVSRRIATVETWAGFRVFARHGRGVRLTLEGEGLTSRIEAALAMLEDGRLNNRRGGGLETVRVGVVQSFARLWLLPRLRLLEGEPSDLRIEPEPDNGLMSLSNGRIAIRYGRGGWPGVVAERLFAERLRPVAAPALACRLRGGSSVQRVLGAPLIHDASEQGWSLWLNGLGMSYERRAEDRLMPGHDLALLAAADGLGVALAREPYASALCRRLGLCPVGEQTLPNPLAFHIVTRPGARHGAVERLVGRLRAAAALTG